MAVERPTKDDAVTVEPAAVTLPEAADGVALDADCGKASAALMMAPASKIPNDFMITFIRCLGEA